MARSIYVALYKAVMNINEAGHRPHGWHSLEGDRWIKRDTPTPMTMEEITPELARATVYTTADALKAFLQIHLTHEASLLIMFNSH